VRWDEYERRHATEDEVRRWWRRWPDANLGIVTGAVSGLVVGVVDPRAGGDEALATLEARFGAHPETVECLTGGGGLHLYFRHPGWPVRTGPIAPGLDVKADGGLVVAPPSIHASGTRYVWETGASPDEHPLADAPAWLTDPSTDGSDPADSPRVFAPRTNDERREFARLWLQFGVHLEPGDRYYLCPFHDDHHPSLHVDAEGCRWYCFGCRRGGGPGRLRRIVGRHATPATGDHAERVLVPPSVHRDTSAPVSATWLQWPTLQPGGPKNVVGEAVHADVLERLAGGRTWTGPRSRWFTARLVRERTNPHDPGAVRVEIGGDVVGYLPRGDAPNFHAVLAQLAHEHVPATARARLTGGWERGPHGRGSIGVVLDVDPHVLRRQPDAPFLPGEVSVRVRSDAHHVAALQRLFADVGSMQTTATVSAPREEAPETLRVMIAGLDVGVLPETSTAGYLPIVERVLAAGFPATCTALFEQRRQRPTLRVRLPRGGPGTLRT
jgi:hypothetical protein